MSTRSSSRGSSKALLHAHRFNALHLRAREPLRHESFNKAHTVSHDGGRAMPDSGWTKSELIDIKRATEKNKEEEGEERARESSRAHGAKSWRYRVYVKRHSTWWCLLNPYLKQLYRVVGSRAFFRR